jgi:broad specificity phosphatase PhoE
VARAFGLEVRIESGLIEASSKLEGGDFRMDASIFTKPAAWRYLVNPFRPSWGEPFVEVADRVEDVIRRAATLDGPGDVALVSHQLPIWMAHRRAVGKPLFHNPGGRRCALSSVTSFVLDSDGFREVGYIAPGFDAVDVGAV